MSTKSSGTIVHGGGRSKGLGARMRPGKRNVIVLAMLAITGTALAQAPPPPPPPPAQWGGQHEWKNDAQWRRRVREERMERLAVLLDLTPAQRQQVQSIFSDEHAKMKGAMQQVRQAMQQARTAHQAARKEAEQKLAAVLTPAQMKKLKLLMPEHRRSMFMMRRMDMGFMPQPDPGPDPGPGPGPEAGPP